MALTSRLKTKKSKSKKSSRLSLRLLNFMAAGFYALQAVLILVLSNSDKSSQPITTGYLTQDKAASAAEGQTVVTQAYHLLFDLNLAYLVAAFLLLSALFHLFLATRYRSNYENGLKNHVNKARWVEHSLSLGLIMVTVALLSGIFELSGLLMVFALTAVLGVVGLMVESNISRGSKPMKWLPYLEGLKFGLIPWLVVVIYVWGAHAYGNAIPGFVYFVYLTVFLLFAAIFANLYMQLKKMGHWEDYVFGEKVLIVVGFLAKSALAWIIFAGTLR